MKIESQEVSLELAQEMKELGVLQDSVFAWYQYVNGKNQYVSGKPYIALKALQNCQDSIAVYHDGYAECPKEICDAPTVAELGEMLPIFISTSKIIGIPSLGWRCVLEIPLSKVHYEEAKTEADARAKMLIYLIKEGLIKAEEVGK